MSDNPNSRRNSVLIALGIAIAVSLWMLSGILLEQPAAPPTRSTLDAAAPGNEEHRMRVMVRRSTAREIPREIVVSSRTEPNRRVEIKAETSGAVVGLGVERGSRVAVGELIARIDLRDRSDQLAEAEALIEQRRLEYEAAERLRGQEFVSDAQIAEAKARLVSAEAARARIMIDIGHTSVEAPFDGVVQDRAVEIGDYVASGDTIAYLVDTDPMVIVGEVNERLIGKLAVGTQGRATLVDGADVEGTIRYLAPVADEDTRTFRVELAVPNADGRIHAGVTAEMKLSADLITAHSLTPALLALADDGTVGVKAVDALDRVVFYPVDIVDSSLDGVLVTGLPGTLRVISVGQGFVTEGEAVVPVEDPAALSQSEDEHPY